MDAGPPGEDAGPSDAGPPVYDPCGALSCGDACTVCSPDDSSCVETPADEFCQPGGSCGTSRPECPVYDPCETLSCGDTCTVCDPTDSSCVETPAVETCQADFTCAASTPVCDPPPTDYYYWGFETDDGGWTTSGEIGEACGSPTIPGLPPCVSGSSWEWGIPIGGTTRPFITGAASGSRAWVTNLNGDYAEWEMSELVSPRMDFSSLTEDPVLDIRFICDVSYVLFRYSIDDGPWTAFFGPGPFPDSRNFATDGFGVGFFDGVSGAPGEWVRGQLVLAGAAGSSNVRIRFGLEDDMGPSEGFGLDEVRVRSGGIR